MIDFPHHEILQRGEVHPGDLGHVHDGDRVLVRALLHRPEHEVGRGEQQAAVGLEPQDVGAGAVSYLRSVHYKLILLNVRMGSTVRALQIITRVAIYISYG